MKLDAFVVGGGKRYASLSTIKSPYCVCMALHLGPPMQEKGCRIICKTRSMAAHSPVRGHVTQQARASSKSSHVRTLKTPSKQPYFRDCLINLKV
eukprot:4329925-Amphidinium_carterae.1